MRDHSLKAFAEFKKIEYRENEAMALHTSFKIGGAADLFLKPKTSEELCALVVEAKRKNLPFFILGNGSNLLVSDKGIEGAVICTTAMNGLRMVGENEIFAEAGATLAALCRFARDHALSGLEFAYGIPGSVGGALYMNAGAYGGDMSMVVTSAQSITVTGELVTRSAGELGLGYRKSIFEENGEIITGVTLRLKKGNPEEITEAMDTFMGKRKASQPLEYPSAGSTFKRPTGYFAAALIDGCGLKGLTVGGAQVSEKHAGFVINRSGATCEDVLALVREIQKIVKEREKVDLETEIIFVGR